MTAILPTTALRVVRPGDDGWDDARLAYNLTADQQPEFIALPRDAREVADAVRLARANGLRVAPQRTGHNATPFASLDGTILLRTDAMNHVEIDTERRVARVGSGAKWQDLVPAASAAGLAGLHGSTGDVSITGYSLGGGLSWYGRKHGLQSNRVTAIELVTADGEHRRVDHEHEPELFWALRGGGGSFGVVTAVEFRLFALTELYAGMMVFPYERAEAVLRTWLDLHPRMPDEMTAIVRMMKFPPIDEVPEEMRGRSLAVVDAAFIGDEAEGAALLAPLRALGPELDTFAMVAPHEIAELHMDPPDPVPYSTRHAMLDAVPDTAIPAMVEAAGPDAPLPLMIVELRPAEGALGRGGEGRGVLERLPGRFVFEAIALVTDPETGAAAQAAFDELSRHFAGHEAGFYFNFVEEKTDPAAFYGPDAYERLRAVKAAYDPDGAIRGNHDIPPAA